MYGMLLANVYEGIKLGQVMMTLHLTLAHFIVMASNSGVPFEISFAILLGLFG